jgi:hypothetical protein
MRLVKKGGSFFFPFVGEWSSLLLLRDTVLGAESTTIPTVIDMKHNMS